MQREPHPVLRSVGIAVGLVLVLALVLIPSMGSNLAVFGRSRADVLIAEHPEIDGMSHASFGRYGEQRGDLAGHR